MCDQQSLRSACAYAQSDQSLCSSLEYSMIVKLLTEHHFEFVSLKGGCRGSSESTHVKMPHCWKSHALAHLVLIANASCEGSDESACLHSLVRNFPPRRHKCRAWVKFRPPTPLHSCACMLKYRLYAYAISSKIS